MDPNGGCFIANLSGAKSESRQRDFIRDVVEYYFDWKTTAYFVVRSIDDVTENPRSFIEFDFNYVVRNVGVEALEV